MVWQEHDAVEQRQVQSPVSGQEQPRALIYWEGASWEAALQNKTWRSWCTQVHKSSGRGLRRSSGLIFCGKESRWDYLAHCSFVSWKPPLHLGCWDQLQAPQCNRDVEMTGGNPAAKMWRNPLYKERLRDLELFSMERRRLGRSFYQDHSIPGGRVRVHCSTIIDCGTRALLPHGKHSKQEKLFTCDGF